MKINARNSPLFYKGLAKWKTFVANYAGPYDFSSSVYAGMNHKVTFVCPTHGHMQSDAKNLMAGKQCQQCMFAARKGKTRLTQKKVLQRFYDTHGDIYSYDKVRYAGQQTPVEIICTRHGSFWQKPEYHWGGSGCPVCFHEDRRGSGQRMGQAEFEFRVATEFGGRISTAGVTYTNSQADICVTCVEHGEIHKTRANWLLNGCNPCPRCNHMKSKGETQVAAFLSIFTPTETRNRKIIKPKELDIYLPEHKLAVEYCGEYWHGVGNKEEEKLNKNRHLNKHLAAAEAGVGLITLYATEWENRQFQIKRLLRARLGKLRGRVFARKCELREVPTPEARAFYDKYHIQGGAGYGDHYGLYWKEKLVACMRFCLGTNDRGAGAQNRTWTLGRYATRINVVGGASRLFKAFVRENNPDVVKSFSDTRLFSGAMYNKLGFDLAVELPPDYVVWSPKLGVRPKPHYQRRYLPKRLREHGIEDMFDPDTDPRTEAEMTYLMGAKRLFDCGKKRWLWSKS